MPFHRSMQRLRCDDRGISGVGSRSVQRWCCHLRDNTMLHRVASWFNLKSFHNDWIWKNMTTCESGLD